jgi:predicted neuraminidase
MYSRFFAFCLLLAVSVWLLVYRAAPIAAYRVVALSPPKTAAAPALPTTSDLKAPTASAHSASLVQLANGELLSFWFAGSREGARDVRIYSARWKDDRWSTPEPVIEIYGVMKGQWRLVRKLGNPVAAQDGNGTLHLFFVTVSLGGWATSNISRVSSQDGGRTWGAPSLLVTSPFMNLSTLVRSPAVSRADGGFDLPVYHEGATKFPEMLHFDREGKLLRKTRMAHGGALIQPTTVAAGPDAALTLLRDAGPARRLRALHTNDAGRTWSNVVDTDQINPDSAVALTRLSDGTFLMAFNPRNEGRTELALAISRDGQHWEKKKTVEYEPGGEFSYPTLLARSDDDIHLVYTWQRRHIRHIRFSRAWLDAAGAQK